MNEARHDVAAGAFRWRLQPDFAQQLGPDGVRLQEWLRTGQATVVKQGPHRVVYRVALPQVTFYVKHNLTPDRVTWFRQLIRPSKARREYDSALEVAARGVATAWPLAWAQEHGLLSNGESLLITRSLDNTQPLHLFVYEALPGLSAARQARIRQRLAETLGRFVAQLHDAGIRHNDLHAGNLLLRLNDGDAPELFLIDLNDVHFGAPLTWRQSFDNLVVLNHWFVMQASRADRLRFLRTYLQARPLPAGWTHAERDPLVRWWVRLLEQATWTSLQKQWRRRDRRCLVDNRYFRRLDAPHVTGHAVTDLDGELAANLLTDPDAPFGRSDAAVLKDSATSTVVEFTAPVNGRPTRLVYKRFAVKKSSTPLSSLVRKPPALRSWQQGQGFRERGLPTARPLLVLHRRRHGLFYEGYLLTEKLDHAQHLHDVLDDLVKLPSDVRRRRLRGRIHLVGQAVRDLHHRQLSHRDLKANNILLETAGGDTGGAGQNRSAIPQPGPSLMPQTMHGAWFLDLVGVSVHQRLTWRCRVRDLARLNASFHERPELSRTDRLRFLRTYLQWGLFSKQGWKTWWRAVAQATSAKLARNARLGRKVA
ncbi:MAG: lipopolysaccharide kinase InaA family protein [Gemmataceae bacterium]|nr:lipopolysaccharide kinase InaA family protein [Gemmataceae bacterium]